jgi:hypothetical protein
MRPFSIRNGPSRMLFHFEPEKYYDIVSYTSYEVTVRLEGRSRTVSRARALSR